MSCVFLHIFQVMYMETCIICNNYTDAVLVDTWAILTTHNIVDTKEEKNVDT